MAGKEDGDKIYVEFSNKEKVSLDTVKDIGLRLFNQQLRSGILIAKGTFTPICKQAIQEMAEADISLETFEEKDLIVNITEHELVPKHIILSNEDKDLLLKKYKLTPNQLPKILLSDPIAKYLGLKRYQVVKIVRPSETAGKYITYRIAV
jgi:DNA-directed RNA polymerase I, II, and III subunit RPABC1